MEKCFLDRYKRLYFSFEHYNNLFICLDSDNLLIKDKEGKFKDSQLSFLNNAIQNADRYENIFIFLNKSLWLEEDDRGWFQSIHPIIKNKVKYVFGAGKHAFKYKVIDGVTYITSGYPPLKKPLLTNPYFPHFLIVDVYKNYHKLEVKDKVKVGVIPVTPIPVECLKDSADNNKTDVYPYVSAQ